MGIVPAEGRVHEQGRERSWGLFVIDICGWGEGEYRYMFMCIYIYLRVVWRVCGGGVGWGGGVQGSCWD